jgi:hypothetical protein
MIFLFSLGSKHAPHCAQKMLTVGERGGDYFKPVVGFSSLNHRVNWIPTSYRKGYTLF